MKWLSRRDQFRIVLHGDQCVRPASVYDPLSARIAEHLGYEIAMLAGSTAALTVLGAPDLVLLTATELVEQASRICRASAIPLLVDADHGYGNALNVGRTVEELATVGVAAVTIEDSVLPVRFGATEKSGLISVEEGVGKMRAALAARPDHTILVIGRTSAPIFSDLGDAVSRLIAYERAGVDALFIVGLREVGQLKAVASATSLPIILGNASGDLEAATLSEFRVRMCLQGHLPILAAVQGTYEAMKDLRAGKPLKEIHNVATGALMKELTRASEFDKAIRTYLSQST